MDDDDDGDTGTEAETEAAAAREQIARGQYRDALDRHLRTDAEGTTPFRFRWIAEPSFVLVVNHEHAGLLRTFTEQLLAQRSRGRRALVIGTVAVMVLTVAWTGVYYAVFTIILGIAAVLWRFAHRASGKRLLIDAIPFAGVGALSVIGFLPALLTLDEYTALTVA